ncbi:hypothetical protein C8R42DRAFT_727354 [Lentinula raphanica]|nr:hypothetical protein C8R42DRAFT_727354 [Lentinula raphanica]
MPLRPPQTPSHPHLQASPAFPAQQTGYQYYYGQTNSPLGSFPVFHYPPFATTSTPAPVGTLPLQTTQPVTPAPIGTLPRPTLQTMQPVTPDRISQLPATTTSTASEEWVANPRKRHGRVTATGNSQRAHRPRLDENGTLASSSGGTSINVLDTAETCGVGTNTPILCAGMQWPNFNDWSLVEYQRTVIQTGKHILTNNKS